MTDARYFASARGPGTAREAAVDGNAVRLREGSAEGSPGDEVRAGIRVLPGDRAIVELAGRSAVAFAERREGQWQVELQGRLFRVRVDDERTHRIRELTAEIAPAAGPAELRAPMPGLVVRVEVAPGDEVRSGQVLVAMEAMKMENELRAESEGVVAEVRVAEGDTVDRDAVLVTLEDMEVG